MSYLDDLLRRAAKDGAESVIWRIDEAFAEMGELPPRAAAFHELVRFCQFDEIEPWLNQSEALRRVQGFAATQGLDRMAILLDDSLAGGVQPALAALVTGNGYVAVPIDTPCPKDCGMITVTKPGWEATELAIQIELRAFTETVLRELDAARDEVALVAPERARNRRAARDETAHTLAGGTAAMLFARLIGGRNPRMAAAEYEDAKARRINRATMVPVCHEAGSPLPPERLASLRERHGSAADELLSVYALHDGAELFIADDEPGFVFAPVSQWDELAREAIEWIAIQFGDAAEIPAYVHSAIAFGGIPGDAATWLLVTEGEHAGKVMIADSDVLIDDEPRFDSIAELTAALLADAWRVLHGGHVRYGDLFPVRYYSD